jgi:hypothetical protein
MLFLFKLKLRFPEDNTFKKGYNKILTKEDIISSFIKEYII